MVCGVIQHSYARLLGMLGEPALREKMSQKKKGAIIFVLGFVFIIAGVVAIFAVNGTIGPSFGERDYASS